MTLTGADTPLQPHACFGVIEGYTLIDVLISIILMLLFVVSSHGLISMLEVKMK